MVGYEFSVFYNCQTAGELQDFISNDSSHFNCC